MGREAPHYLAQPVPLYADTQILLGLFRFLATVFVDGVDYTHLLPVHVLPVHAKPCLKAKH